MVNNAGGKGSAVRPLSVSRQEYGNNFDAIFGNKKKEAAPDKLIMATTMGEIVKPIDGDDPTKPIEHVQKTVFESNATILAKTASVVKALHGK